MSDEQVFCTDVILIIHCVIRTGLSEVWLALPHPNLQEKEFKIQVCFFPNVLTTHIFPRETGIFLLKKFVKHKHLNLIPIKEQG
jgi:hypothetical protein